MKSKIAMFNLNSKSTFSAILLSLTLMVAAFWVSPAAAQKYVTDPSTGKVVVAPKYGGTITYVDFGGSAAGAATDYYVIGAAVQNVQLFQEKLGFANWAIDRDVWAFNTQHLPDFALTGRLAESWEQPDPLTIIFKIPAGRSLA